MTPFHTSPVYTFDLGEHTLIIDPHSMTIAEKPHAEKGDTQQICLTEQELYRLYTMLLLSFAV